MIIAPKLGGKYNTMNLRCEEIIETSKPLYFMQILFAMLCNAVIFNVFLVHKLAEQNSKYVNIPVSFMALQLLASGTIATLQILLEIRIGTHNCRVIVANF